MIKKLVILCCFSLFFQTAQAAREQIENVYLQAWWSLNWKSEDSSSGPVMVSTPVLSLRYFKKEVAGNITVVLLSLKQNEIKKIVKDNFSAIPDSFFKHQEGHAEMFGNIIIDNISESGECDGRFYVADYISFLPQAEVSRADMFKIKEDSNCESPDYSVYYELKPHRGEVAFRKFPRIDAPLISIVPEGALLIKIKTINQRWALMGIMDYNAIDFIGEPSGYIEFKDLDILN